MAASAVASMANRLGSAKPSKVGSSAALSSGSAGRVAAGGGAKGRGAAGGDAAGAEGV